MNPFEEGFAAGERAAWEDRRRLIKRQPPPYVRPGWSEGFWAAYRPRSLTWALHKHPERSFTETEREEA